MPPVTTTTPTAPAHLTRDQLLDRARAALGEIAPALRHLSTDEILARADRFVDGVRHHAGRFLTDARAAVGDAAGNAEQLVAERLTARIKAKVAPPIQAAIVIAVVALLAALLALYRTRGRP